MDEVAGPDWTKGIAKLLRDLLDSGASDDDLDRFISAQRDGNVELVEALLSTARQINAPAVRRCSESGVEATLARIRVAALRPVVNDLTAQELHFYIHFVIHASKILVAQQSDEAMWDSRAVVEAAAASLKRAAFDSMRALGQQVLSPSNT